MNSGLEPSARVSEVEIGRYYGDAGARTLRVVNNEPILHPFQPYSTVEMAHQLAYFQKVFGLSGTLPPSDQIWYWKDLLTLFALVAAFVSLVPLARLQLANVAYFRPLVHPLPPAVPPPQGRSKRVFWTLLVSGALIAYFTYIPMTELSQWLFVEASGREATWFFPQRMNNGVMLWALCNGLAGFLLFFLSNSLRVKAGMRFEGQPEWRSMLLAGLANALGSELPALDASVSGLAGVKKKVLRCFQWIGAYGLRGRQPGIPRLHAGSVVGGLAEAATGPPGPASYRLEGSRTVVDARTRKPRCEVRGLRLRFGNSRPRQRSSQQGASTPGVRGAVMVASTPISPCTTLPGSTPTLLGVLR